MAGWTIERVRYAADLDGVLEVEQASFQNPWTRDMYVWELQHAEISHVYTLRLAPHVVVGFCAFWLVVDEVHINNLAVRPEFRGRGYGTVLLHHVLSEGARLGARRTTLEVRVSNEAARRLYERLGFKVAGRRRDYYASPVEDALVLWRSDLSPTTGAPEEVEPGPA